MTSQRARAVLAVPAGATAEEIEAAFRRGVRAAHPDRGGDATRTRLLLDARRQLHATVGEPDTHQRVVVVPASTWRDVLVALVERLRLRPHRPPPRVR